MRVDARQSAWPASISKRAPSITRTSLRLESTSCERPDIRLSHVGGDSLAFLDRITIRLRLRAHSLLWPHRVCSVFPASSWRVREQKSAMQVHSLRRNLGVRVARLILLVHFRAKSGTDSLRIRSSADARTDRQQPEGRR